MASSPPPPFLVAFFDPELKAAGPHGATLDTILTWSDNALEYHHDYIQTLFPLPERSMITSAPLVTPAAFDAFRSPDSSVLRDRLNLALARMLAFYGLQSRSAVLSDTAATSDCSKTTSINGVEIVRSADWARRKGNWVTRFSHNHLRITRIIRSLRVLGLEESARALHAFLVGDETVKAVVGRTSFMYWKRAAERPLHLPPDEDDEGAVGVRWLQGR